jgi:hypothetical protein
VLRTAVEEMAVDVRVRRSEAGAPALRHYAETRYRTKSWSCKRRVDARIEASIGSMDWSGQLPHVADDPVMLRLGVG